VEKIRAIFYCLKLLVKARRIEESFIWDANKYLRILIIHP